MAGAGDIRAGRAYCELYADQGPLEKGLREASNKMKAWGKSIALIGAGLGGLGAAIEVPLKLAANAFAETGGDLLNMSRRTGIAVEELSALAFAANRSGVSTEELETGIKRMQKAMIQGAEGSAELRQAFAEMGIGLGDLIGKTASGQLEAIADGMSKITNPAKQTELAMAILGRTGTQMLPFLKKGEEGIAALMVRASELGVVMSTADAEAASKFRGSIRVLTNSLSVLTFQIGAAVAPAFERLNVFLLPLVTGAIRWVKENRPMVAGLDLLATGAVVAGAGIAALGGAIRLVGAGLAGFIPLIHGATKAYTLLCVAEIAALTPLLALGAAGVAFGAALVAIGAGQAGLENVLKAITTGNIAGAFELITLGISVSWYKMLKSMKEGWLGFVADLPGGRMGQDFFRGAVGQLPGGQALQAIRPLLESNPPTGPRFNTGSPSEIAHYLKTKPTTPLEEAEKALAEEIRRQENARKRAAGIGEKINQGLTGAITSSAAGTFSAEAAKFLGGGSSVQQRQLDTQEEIRAAIGSAVGLLERIMRNTEDYGGASFI